MAKNQMNVKRALDFANFVGMPWRIAEDKNYVLPSPDSLSQSRQVENSWTGKELLVTDNRNGEEICHEVCHWIVSPIKFRKLAEFGLGYAPYQDVRHVDPHPEVVHSNEDYEIMTCLLQIYLFKQAKLRWRVLADELSFYDFDKPFDKFLKAKDNKDYWNKIRRRKLDTIIDQWTQRERP